MSERSVFSINPPAVGDAKYLLMVYRNAGPFGGASRPSVFAVDEFEATEGAYRGKRNGEVVVEFPTPASYLLVASSLIESLTPREAAERQKADEDEMKDVFGEEVGGQGPAELALSHPGNYA